MRYRLYRLVQYAWSGHQLWHMHESTLLACEEHQQYESKQCRTVRTLL